MTLLPSAVPAGDPPSWQRWAVQMAEWVAATVIARTVCGIVVVGARRLLAGMARLLDDAFAGHPTAELFSVMLAGPLAMNLIQVRAILALPASRQLASCCRCLGQQRRTQDAALMTSQKEIIDQWSPARWLKLNKCHVWSPAEHRWSELVATLWTQAWLQDAVLKMKRTAVDAADEGALLLAERGRSDAPQLEEVKPAPSRGRPAAVAAASRSGQVALASLPPEVRAMPRLSVQT